jgi:hypothetical protein
MKRSKKCFDLSGLEHCQGDAKRYRTDSEQTDESTDTDLSEMSENFEKSAIISTPFQFPSSKSVAFPSPPLSLDMIGCKFDFEPEDYAFGSSFGSASKSKVSALGGLGGFVRKLEHQ